MKKIALIGLPAITAILFFNAPAAFAYSIYTTTSTNTTTSFDFGSAWNELSTPFQGFFNSMQTISPSDTEIQIQNQIQSRLPSLPQAGENILTTVVNFLSWIVNWLIYIANQFAGWVVMVIRSIH